MKKNTIIATLIAAFAISATYAQDDSAKEAQNANPDNITNLDIKTRIQLMKRFDKNGDGKLDEEERAEAKKALSEKAADLKDMRLKFAKNIIAKYDKNGDNKLDEEELVAFLEEHRRNFDADRQNRNRRRAFTPPKEVLAKWDKDGDGQLSREERRAMFEDARQRRAALINKYDTDKDGKLSDAERNNLIQDPEVQNMMKRMLSNPLPQPPPNR